jgi:hypothetical protein
MIIQNFVKRLKLKWVLVLKTFKFFSLEAQLAWPAELSSSAGGDQLNFGAELQLGWF